ncbi:MAG: hypothetical protein V3T77_08050 [Planctomycetota bacterium]
MKRREFLKGAAVATGGWLGGCTASDSAPAVQTQPRIRWRLASSFPRSLDTIFGAADRVSKRVQELTGGRFTIRVHPAGEIVPGLQVLDAVQQAIVEIGSASRRCDRGAPGAYRWLWQISGVISWFRRRVPYRWGNCTSPAPCLATPVG